MLFRITVLPFLLCISCSVDPTSYFSENLCNFQDILPPPSWVCPRKRMTHFGTNYVGDGNDSPTRDKRKYEPFNEFVPSKKFGYFLKTNVQIH